MSHSTITRDADGSMTITKSDDGPVSPGEVGQPIIVRHDSGDMPAGAAFTVGVIVGMIVLLLIQRLIARRRHRPAQFERDDRAARDSDRVAADVAALARRTATLETIVTDPAQRTLREIDALR